MLALGLMSGTSCDGVSAALAEFRGRAIRVIASCTFPYPRTFASALHRAHALTTPELARLNMALGEMFALAALRVMHASRVSPRSVRVIGSHGHTVYHGPTDPMPTTLQLGEPAVIAERTGLPVVADFRMRDIAAGGEGAPLIPFFDHYFFGRGRPRALQNIGGIANVTLVGRGLRPLAFDTGPGNCLIDAMVRTITRGRQRFDASGRLAARGEIDHAAVKRLWAHPYFKKRPPKSTGPELFTEAFVTHMFGARWAAKPHDALATVTYFTAYSIAESYRRFGILRAREVIVSGGGGLNRTLMQHLGELLAPIPVRSIADYGVPLQAKEPVAFAFLALRTMRGRINHLPSTTGAAGARMLGTITPGHPQR